MIDLNWIYIITVRGVAVCFISFILVYRYNTLQFIDSFTSRNVINWMKSLVTLRTVKTMPFAAHFIHSIKFHLISWIEEAKRRRGHATCHSFRLQFHSRFISFKEMNERVIELNDTPFVTFALISLIAFIPLIEWS